MTFVVEDGSGIKTATAYATVAQVTAYLTDRNRGTQNSWDTIGTALQQSAIVEATDYIETVFGLCFKGSKLYDDLNAARSSLLFSGNPINTETVTIGTTVYTFVTTLGVAFDVLIGADLLISLFNLARAIVATESGEGVNYGTGTTAHEDVGVLVIEPDIMTAIAKIEGIDGNAIATTETLTASAWNFVTLQGGSTTKRGQPLSFPRKNLLDDDFNQVEGMPDDLIAATSEYAVRSVVADIDEDPAIDPITGIIKKKREKIGPIEEETEYVSGTFGVTRPQPYPAADRLLSKYLKSRSVIRG